MTVTPKKHSTQPGSSSYSNTSSRSGSVQMDEIDALRLRHSSEDSLSLASSTEPINLEDPHYALLRGELESDHQNLEAESWSVAVDQNYLKALNKEAVKRQDVIYELIQTEMHHVRTIKILLRVYMHELRQSMLIEEAKLERLFLGVESLLTLHQHFLNLLKVRQSQSQEEGSPNNYQIKQLGDILIAQFSGALGEGMMECYSVFCSHQTEAISFYKEQLQNNKKLQALMRKIGQLPLVRRLGIPECFLLVTQRITKYPVLVERIIQNTEADTDEHKSLVQGLTLIRDTISQVNAQVSEYEKVARLREIGLRLEPKSQGRLKDGRVLRREDLLQGNKTLLHEGTVTWKTSGRQKDIHAVLLSDVLLLLQEKDQKLVFAAVDNKPPVISLQRLIVREVAHEDKAMYLICACTTSMPEMYEIHTRSKEECITWTALIREAVNCYPEEALYRELTARLQHFQDMLKMRDDQIKQSLTEKQQIFAALYETVTEQETPHKGLLLRGDASDLQLGGTLLRGAINEVETLQNLLSSRIKDPNLLMDEKQTQGGLLMRAETFGVADSYPGASAIKNGDAAERPGGSDAIPVYISHNTSDPQLRKSHSSESLEQSTDEDTPDGYLSSINVPEAEVYDRVILLGQRLYSLEAIIAQQDSQIELQHAFQMKSKQPARHYSSLLLEQEKQRNLEKQKEELANLHKLQAQHREEQQRWEKEKERQRMQIEALEAQLQQREEDCRKWEEKLKEEKAELEKSKEDYQQDLENLRESTKSVYKDKERLSQEMKRLEKIKKLMPGHSNYDDPSQFWNLSSHPSFRGSTVNGGGTLTTKPHILPTNSNEIPPKVPPRRESISPMPVKPELPVHLISTTNQEHKPAAVQQQIPTKLAALSKGKEKGFKTKGSHQRTHSAAGIDVSQVLPIRVTGKEGGSLRAKRNSSPQRIHQSGAFNPPESVHNVKTSQSFSTNKRSSNEAPPPPPPFPKEVLEKGKEKVIFL
ncbi:rho guanine nucleotide exchange factor 18a [Plectropomus leopardus]|uniref:rho guanine nucleotide exchange factor 18a n=1 Tax=Plectropomus leopardus TaxID=160734 RepID=UPI001C4D18BE|nr:rho guanine nucleotide exchange factor 18a [Plectropomus leopardus]XP_042354206.1 rho guanine nucleotide exchange factor 18a [Plectropomus leopardus]XP_042354207.1 rho guanine nucleotide exchange factor 18a [Plectropomus leopardus]XP_042354208.1 rho guanine nucleotide exchange factor 18a [Plectropomus leopardus]